jgi:hypothetical protein
LVEFDRFTTLTVVGFCILRGYYPPPPPTIPIEIKRGFVIGMALNISGKQ